jgi:flagellar protein FlaG
MDPGAINPVASSLAAAFAHQAADRRTEQREIIQAVHAVNRSEMLGRDSELKFLLDPDTRRPVVRIVNRETGEVLNQIPPERVLRMAQDLKRRARS